MDNIQNKVIRLSGEEKKVLSNGAVVIKVKDEKNLTYTIWTTKKDGTESLAAASYKKFTLGQYAKIGFKEETKSTEDGKTYASRTIISLEPAEGPQQASNPSQGASHAALQNFDSQRASIERQVAFKAAVELVVAGKSEFANIPHLTEQFANLIAGKLPAPTPKPAPADEELPTIQVDNVVDEEISVEDIPF
jgi:hypothetical protein